MNMPPYIYSMEDKKQIDFRASSGIVKDYYKEMGNTNPDFAPNPTKEELDDYLSIYRKDSIISGAIDTVAEETVKNRGYFIGSKSAKEKAEKLFSKLDFYSVAEVDVKTKHIYGDSFVEMKPSDDGKPVGEIHNLETTEMFIGYDNHGDVVFFEQRPFDITTDNKIKYDEASYKRWSGEEKEQIFFSCLKKIGSKVRSYSPLEPILKSLIARQYGHYLLESTFKNYKPQITYISKTPMSREQTDALVAGIRACDKDPSKKLLVMGEMDIKETGQYNYNKDIVDILNYFRQEILTATKVPGIYVGITDGSNRGVGEFEATAFQTHLLRLQRDVEKLGNKILERSNISAVFKMRPPSIKSQTDIIDQAKKMRDMGYGDDVITPFLYENGISVPMDATFEKEDVTSMDDYESRQGSGKGVTEGKFKLDENGRSQDGKDKTAEKDAKLRSSSWLGKVFDFGKVRL